MEINQGSQSAQQDQAAYHQGCQQVRPSAQVEQVHRSPRLRKDRSDHCTSNSRRDANSYQECDGQIAQAGKARRDLEE
jgi:hypothetical protein